MLMKLFRYAKVAQAVAREHFKKRSPEWPAVRKLFLGKKPTCAVCGGQSFLQVHHIVPFHEQPELELHLDNLITLCMSVDTLCHLKIGHGGAWKFFSRSVAQDAAQILASPEVFDEIAAKAEENRVPNDPNN